MESCLLAGCGLALFFPLLIFLSGIVDLIPAAVLALVLVSGLLLVFLSFTAGWRQAQWRVGLLLIIFLGFFSLGILTPWQGLMLTSRGLLLVGTLMPLYTRRPPAPEPEPVPPSTRVISEPDLVLPTDGVTPESESAPLQGETIPESESTLLPGEDTADPAGFCCPYCVHTLVDDYCFCPGCGHDTNQFRRCEACGVRQFVPLELGLVHCTHCG